MRIPVVIIFHVACFLIFNIPGNKYTDQSTTWLGKLPGISNDMREKIDGDQSNGNLLYTKYCLTCHQENGSGVRGMFPPLAGNAKITGPSNDLILIVLFGLKGPVVVNGRDYNQLMPAQNYLSDKQIADILSYIRNTWGNKAPPITPQEVGKVRKAGK